MPVSMAFRLVRLAVVPILCTQVAFAQLPQPLSLPNIDIGFNGAATAIEPLPNGRVLLAGQINRVGGVPRDTLAIVEADGSVANWTGPTFGNGPQAVWIRAMAAGTDGSFYLCGEFTLVSGLPRVGIVKLLPDGSVDTGWNASLSQGGCTEIGLDNAGHVFVSGNYSQVNAQPLGGFAKLSASTGAVDTGWAPHANGSVYGFVYDGSGHLFVAGDFTNIGGTARSGLAKISAGGSATVDATWNPAPTTGAPRASVEEILLAQDGSAVYVSGTFSAIGGQPRANLAKLSATGNGAAIAQWSPGSNPTYRSLALDGTGALYTASSLNGYDVKRRDSQTGALDSTWNGVSDNYITALSGTSDGSVIAVGAFVAFADQMRVGFARFGPAGLQAANPVIRSTRTAEITKVVRQPNGGLIVAGKFGVANGLARRSILRVTPEGTLDTDWNPGPTNDVWSIAVDASGDVYVGGAFTRIGGRNVEQLSKLHGDGIGDAYNIRFFSSTAASNLPYSLALSPDGILYMGGGAPRLVRFILNTPVGSLQDHSWTPSIDGNVHTMHMAGDGKLYISGDFRNINGQSRNNAARFDSSGQLDGWNPAPTGGIRSFATDDQGYLIAAGHFLTIGGRNQAFLARLHPDSGAADPGWSPQIDGGLEGVAIAAGAIYVGGQFTVANGLPRSNLARYSGAAMNIDLDWNPASNTPVLQLIQDQPGRITIGGAFTMLSGESRLALAALPLTIPDEIFADGFD